MIDRIIAHTIEMSFDIPKSEQDEAKLASASFQKVIVLLDTAKKHLNTIYDPFKSSPNVSPEMLKKYRGAIFKFKEQIKENFENVKSESFQSISKFSFFKSDVHVTELINAFKDSVTSLEAQVNILLDILDEIKPESFAENVIKSIELIRKDAFETEKLIKERIIEYIDANILAKDWISEVGDKLKTEIKSRIPYTTQLFYERQKELESV